MKAFLTLSGLIFVAACAQVPSVGPDHPAHAGAPEAAPSPLSGMLAGAPQASEIYTCPMHPEIQQSEPGKCPKCGMALVPKSSLQEGHEHVH